MQLEFPNSRRNALTRTEVLCCVAAIGVVLSLLWRPTFIREKEMSPRTQCISNLKQIGLNAMLWATDHNGVLPWNSTNCSAFGISDPARLFAEMSNELSTPRILVCPSDKQRRRRKMESFAELSTNDVSYFVVVDAPVTLGTNEAPQRVLFGDRDIDGFAPKSRCQSAAVTLPSFAGNQIRWLGKLHESGGNLALDDGSASLASATFATELLSKSNKLCGVSHVAIP